jgi:glycosidase
MTPAHILDNHDMTRFLWLAENDTRRLKLALTFLMSLSGVPIVYYGTEVGLSQREGPPRQDAYAREPMPWANGQQADVLAQARWLITQRRQRISLRRGQMAQVGLANLRTLVGDVADDATAAQASQLGALARWRGEEATIIAFNNGDLTAQFTIEPAALPFSLRPGAAVRGYLLTPDGVTALAGATSGQLGSELPPLSAAMLFIGIEGERA